MGLKEMIPFVGNQEIELNRGIVRYLTKFDSQDSPVTPRLFNHLVKNSISKFNDESDKWEAALNSEYRSDLPDDFLTNHHLSYEINLNSAQSHTEINSEDNTLAGGTNLETILRNQPHNGIEISGSPKLAQKFKRSMEYSLSEQGLDSKFKKIVEV